MSILPSTKKFISLYLKPLDSVLCKYLIHKKPICIVVGVDSVNQLKDLIKYVNKEFVPVNSLDLKCDEKLLIDASFWEKI
jgi:hypothetical protein